MAAGAVARISDRIIDCPVNVIVIGVGSGGCAESFVHTKTVSQAALVKIRRVFNMIGSVALASAASLASFKLAYAASLFINILGSGKFFPALEDLRLNLGIRKPPARRRAVARLAHFAF